MSHSTDDSRPAAPSAGKPTLEALLRLKRAERPDAAFWNEFDRGLRRKQLAAIIEPKPWWLGLALLGRRLTPVGLPLSAAAAALFAIMITRTQAPISSTSAPVEFGAVQAANPPPAATPGGARLIAATPSALAPETPVLVATATERAPAQDRAALAAQAISEAAAERVVVSAPNPGPDAPVVASLLEIAPPKVASPTPSEITIAQNLAAVRAADPELLARSTRLEHAELSLSDEVTIEPALKMEVRNPRHARVLLAMAENSSVEAISGVSHLRERMARSLDHDEALSGSSSRLGVGGDRLSLRF